MLMPMSDASAPAQGSCVFCGTMTERAGHSVKTHRLGTPNADGTIPLIPMPPVWMCENDLARYIRNEVRPGWCNACEAWGAAFTTSACGETFLPLR